jgi:hypothetical protein
MADTSAEPGATVASALDARAQFRAQLRADLTASRQALRLERQLAAVAAATRPPRWRAARAASAQPKAADEARCGTILAPDDAAALPRDKPAETPPDRAEMPGSVFAALLCDFPPLAAPPKPRMAGPAPTPGADRPEPPPPMADTPPATQAPTAAPMVAPTSAAMAAADPEATCFAAAQEWTTAALGPGMLERLRLLGYARLTDLAHAEPAALRHALGDVSRLLNIEGWIAAAAGLAASERKRGGSQPPRAAVGDPVDMRARSS